MSDSVSWHVRLKLHPGKLLEFKTLTGEMIQAARSERGVLAYQRFLSRDETTVHIYEQYEDSQCACEHLKHFAERFGGRFASLVQREEFTVFGEFTPELQALLEAYGANDTILLDGFVATDRQ